MAEYSINKILVLLMVLLFLHQPRVLAHQYYNHQLLIQEDSAYSDEFIAILGDKSPLYSILNPPFFSGRYMKETLPSYSSRFMAYLGVSQTDLTLSFVDATSGSLSISLLNFRSNQSPSRYTFEDLNVSIAPVFFFGSKNRFSTSNTFIDANGIINIGLISRNDNNSFDLLLLKFSKQALIKKIRVQSVFHDPSNAIFALIPMNNKNDFGLLGFENKSLFIIDSLGRKNELIRNISIPIRSLWHQFVVDETSNILHLLLANRSNFESDSFQYSTAQKNNVYLKIDLTKKIVEKKIVLNLDTISTSPKAQNWQSFGQLLLFSNNTPFLLHGITGDLTSTNSSNLQLFSEKQRTRPILASSPVPFVNLTLINLDRVEMMKSIPSPSNPQLLSGLLYDENFMVQSYGDQLLFFIEKTELLGNIGSLGLAPVIFGFDTKLGTWSVVQDLGKQYYSDTLGGVLGFVSIDTIDTRVPQFLILLFPLSSSLAGSYQEVPESQKDRILAIIGLFLNTVHFLGPFIDGFNAPFLTQNEIILAVIVGGALIMSVIVVLLLKRRKKRLLSRIKNL